MLCNAESNHKAVKPDNRANIPKIDEQMALWL